MPSHICVSSGSSPVAFTVRIYAVFAPLLLVVQLPSSAFSVRFSFASAGGHQAEAAPGHVYRQVRGLTTQTMFWIPGQQPPLGRRRPTMVCPVGAARRVLLRTSSVDRAHEVRSVAVEEADVTERAATLLLD